MTFDEELYLIIGRRLKAGNADISNMLAVLTNHLGMLIQACMLPKNGKLQIADELTGLMRAEIEKDPHPLKRSMH